MFPLRCLTPALGAALVLCISAPPTAKAEGGWTTLFDGKSLKGWHISSSTGHGTGGKWEVRDSAIVGSQDRPGNGGILITDRAFGNFEVSLEMNNDYGPDSGLFLRSNEKGQCYQAMIDYHDAGNLMGVYGEGIGGFIAKNFDLLQTPNRIRMVDYPAFPLSFKVEDWPRVWKAGKWNELRASITGNPPTIQTWINGTKIMKWSDTQKRLPDQGGIAVQVHGGGDYTRQFVRYRKIRVRELP